MKKRIRLGISSMNSIPSKATHLGRAPLTSTSSNPISDSAFSDLSASDLDDMFSSNLRLLYDYDENETLTKTKPASHSNFLSSLNIYVSPRDVLKSSAQIEISQCKPITDSTIRSMKLTRSRIYSSYETLYDHLISKRTEDEKMSQSIVECSQGTIDDYLKFGSNISCDSARTLKSISSDNSSHVSSLKSDELNNTDITGSNQSLPASKSISNELHFFTKIRPRPDRIMSRPISYHVGDSMGYYYSNKPPSYPYSDHSSSKSGKKDGTYAPSNIIISRSMRTPFLNSHNSSKTSLFLSSNAESIQNIDTFTLSSNNSLNNKESNIINNHAVQQVRCWNRSTISVNPPVVPPRNRIKKGIPKLTNVPQKQENQIMSELQTSVPVRSSINLKIGPPGNNIRSNGENVSHPTPNYNNQFSYQDNQKNCISRTRITEIRRNDKKN